MTLWSSQCTLFQISALKSMFTFEISMHIRRTIFEAVCDLYFSHNSVGDREQPVSMMRFLCGVVVLVGAVSRPAPVVSQGTGGPLDRVEMSESPVAEQMGVIISALKSMFTFEISMHIRRTIFEAVCDLYFSHNSVGDREQPVSMMRFLCGVVVLVGAVSRPAPVVSQGTGGPLDRVEMSESPVAEQMGVIVGQVVEHHLSRCHLVLITTTRHSLITSRILRLLEQWGLLQLPETVVVAVGKTGQARAVLLHHGLHNTAHALFLALHDPALNTPHPHSRLSKACTGEASTDGGVSVYQRCLYCNNGEADIKLIHNLNFNSPAQSWEDLFQENCQDLRGHKMRIVTPTPTFPSADYGRCSEAPGTLVVLKDSLDTRLIHTFAAKLNFTFDVEEDPSRSWGVDNNGTFSGMMGQIQRGEKDFTTVTAPTAKRLRAGEYLRGYPSQPFTIVSLKPAPLPKYLALISPFEGEVWVAVVVSVVAWGVTLWLLQKARQTVSGGRRVSLLTSLLYEYGALLQNLPSDPSVSVSGRMVVGWWLVFCLIITTGFSSSLMAHLTVQGRTRPLDSYEDLVNQPAWKWGTEKWMLSESVVDYFEKNSNPAVNKVYHKMEVGQVDEALKKVLAGGFSFISYKNYVTVIVKIRFTDARGDTSLYISKALPMFLDFGWCVRRGAPFYKRFQHLMTHLEDAGIISYWLEDVIAKRVREERKALANTTLLGNVIQDEGKQVVLSLNHLQGAFYVLLVGSGAALLLLLGENLAHSCSSPQ
ncbi:glutamate receptor-like [Procambarus clarkii]|uniref:glutamate receptor-like n=1 Tax=Procambarus clarkii TaxID=6728 RepID=UPI003743F15C